MTLVELMAYGDFDMRYTDSVWMHTGSPNMSTLDFSMTRDLAKAKCDLKNAGFVQVKTHQIVVGGGL